MTKLIKVGRSHKWIVTLLMVVLIVGVMAVPCLAAGSGGGGSGGSGGTGDVASAVESTWNDARTQVEQIVNNVVFPVIDVILSVLFFVKVATSYFEYRKHGQFEFAAPCILFACLVFSLTAPLYIWTII
ncbi:Protein of unknown function [Ruminococcaceae bacterium KH2T8]|nr:Protein of unknown function [Ruminococcaceae bacterium KH2T8]